MKRLARDERGTTMVELIVGLASGLVILVGLTTMIVVTLHTTARVSARVDATSRARVTLDRLVEELHSACVAPKTPPIRTGSTDTKLGFVHATGAAATPTPVLSVVYLTGTTLKQADYAWKEGAPPFWVFEEKKPFREVTLLTKVSPLTPTKPIFSYYSSSAGATSEISLATPLTQFNAEHTIHVNVAFMAAPSSGSTEEATPARMRGGATFRLSAVSYNEAAPAMPCQ